MMLDQYNTDVYLMLKLITLHPLFHRGKVMSCAGLSCDLYSCVSHQNTCARHTWEAHSRPVRHAVERTGKTVLELFESEFIFCIRLRFLTLIEASIYISTTVCTRLKTGCPGRHSCTVLSSFHDRGNRLLQQMAGSSDMLVRHFRCGYRVSEPSVAW